MWLDEIGVAFYTSCPRDPQSNIVGALVNLLDDGQSRGRRAECAPGGVCAGRSVPLRDVSLTGNLGVAPLATRAANHWFLQSVGFRKLRRSN
jgi:hypothetical protein